MSALDWQGLGPYAPFAVHAWPLWARRAFVVLLPISGPLWCVGVIAIAIVVTVGIVAVGPPLLLALLLGNLWRRQ